MTARSDKNPPKFKPERCEAIIKSIGRRVPYKIAAQANGIGEETLYGWLRDGLADLENNIDSPKARFSESIKKIEEKRMAEHLDIISTAPERWQSHAWILERRWWKHFSPNAALVEFNEELERMKKKYSKEGSNGHIENQSTQQITQE